MSAALTLWRAREATFPAFTRRMTPDALDMVSGAWAMCVEMAEQSPSLAFLIAGQKGLAISCTACLHTKTRDVLAMSVAYGEEKTLAELEPKLAPCPKCSGRAKFEVWSKVPPAMGMKD